jgi:hypothetical protein
MDVVELIRDFTHKLCDRDFDLDLVELTFAEDFVHHANGTLALHRRDGSTERMAVMAIWTVADGQVTGLREVDAPAA